VRARERKALVCGAEGGEREREGRKGAGVERVSLGLSSDAEHFKSEREGEGFP